MMVIFRVSPETSGFAVRNADLSVPHATDAQSATAQNNIILVVIKDLPGFIGARPQLTTRRRYERATTDPAALPPDFNILRARRGLLLADY
jgi:hypothetical protein